MAFQNPACAAVNLLGTVVGTQYIGSTYIGWVPLGQGVALSGYAVQFINGIAILVGTTVDWFDDPDAWTLRVVEEVDPDDSVLKQRVYIDWNIDLTLVPDLTFEYQVGGTVNGTAFTHCVIMPNNITVGFVGTLIGVGSDDKIYTIDPSEPLSIATPTEIHTLGSAASGTGRMAWDPAAEKIWFWDDGAADDNALFTMDIDGGNVAEVFDSALGTVDGETSNCQLTSNNRIAYTTTQWKGIVDLDGSNQNNYATNNFGRRDLAPTGDTDECWTVDGDGNPIYRVNYEDGVTSTVLGASGVDNIAVDRADPTVAYYNTANPIRKVNLDGSGDAEIWDGTGITAMGAMFGVVDGVIYFSAVISGVGHICSINVDGSNFQDLGAHGGPASFQQNSGGITHL